MPRQNRLKIGCKSNVDETMGGQRRQADLQARATTRSLSKLTQQSNSKSFMPLEQDTIGNGIGSKKNGGSRSKRKFNELGHNDPQGDREEDFDDHEDDINMDDIGHNSHIPNQEEDQNLDLPIKPSNDTGGNKGRISKKLVDRVQIASKTHEVMHPTSRDRNESNDILLRRKNQYLHQHSSTRNASPQNNGNSSQDTRSKGVGSEKNEGSTSKRKMNSILNEPGHSDPEGDPEEDFNDNDNDLNMDANGFNNHSPTQEEGQNLDLPVEPSNDTGGNKRKIAKKFVDRVDIALKAHEAANPIPRERNKSSDILSRRKTQYLHEPSSTSNASPQNDGNSSQASATSAKRKRGQRGKYRCLVVGKKTLQGKVKLVVDIPNYVFQAVGNNARDLVNYCGYVMRTKNVMDASPWKKVVAKHGEAMWQLVKNNFSIMEDNQLPRLKAFVLYAMQRLYRYWKCRLHAYYKECGDTHEERLENPPQDMRPENWKKCCELFNSEEFKKISARNSQNRRSDKWCPHTTGNLSFAEVETILTKKNNGVKPDADVIWLAEHTRTNDQGELEWVNDARSKEVHEKLHQLVQDKEKEGAPQTQEEMLLEVLGPKSGYTRGKGSGYGGSIKSRIQEEQQQQIIQQQQKIDEYEIELFEHKGQISNLVDSLKESQNSIAILQKQMLEMRRLMALDNARSRARVEDNDACYEEDEEEY